MMRIRRCYKVQEAGDDQKGLAIIGRGVRRHHVAPIHNSRQKIKGSRAQIADEPEDVEDIAAIRLVDPALHAKTDQEHRDH